MNNRIQQMIYNLNEKVGIHWTNEDKLEFAESIVQECLRVGTTAFFNNHSVVPTFPSNTIKQHFGVE